MRDHSCFLRSLNLVYDADEPKRVAHFQPTAKCAQLLKNLAGLAEDRAFFIIAPYGTGKSLTATYLLHLVQNKPEAAEILARVQKRLEPVNPELAAFSKRRLRTRTAFGIGLALEGYHADIGSAFQDAAVEALARVKMGREATTIRSLDARGVEGAVRVLETVREKAQQKRCDRIVIIWDEFGRHLERMVAGGMASRLAEIQTVAEYASRVSVPPMTFSVVMHQGLLQYAGALSQSAIAEWRKIEGRFASIQYVDDSKELYRLIGFLVNGRRRAEAATKELKKTARRAKELGLFGEFTIAELEELLSHAYPLEPVTLYLLPRLAARAAQNERTLFGFLYSQPLARPIGPAELFDYFAPAMQADTSVGGTYRVWLETESAISKATSEAEVEALKTASLLGLGLAGERTKVSIEVLQFALAPTGERTEAHEAVESLLKRKLLLFRKHTNQVALWHGTDVDLRGRLAEEQERFVGSFDLTAFLAKEFPPPTWRPTGHNDRFYLRRYFASRYEDPGSLEQRLSELTLKGLQAGTDGEILYAVCDSAEDVRKAEKFVRAAGLYGQVVLAVPDGPLGLRAAALEVACIERMLVDDRLLSRDPLVAAELQTMLDDSRMHLQRSLERLVNPDAGGAVRWYHRGKRLAVSSAAGLRRALSDIATEVFPKTPCLNNEMIVRHRPTPIIVNARKKVVLGILERHGMEKLGLEGESADASIFRTVLLNSGLYRQDSRGAWVFAQPEEIEAPGLAEIWAQFRALLTEPCRKHKDLARFFADLQEPPWGLRRGVIPILFAAALKAFPSALSIVHVGGGYVADLLPSEIEDICRSPGAYRLTVLPLDQAERRYLLLLARAFNPDSGLDGIGTTDLLRACFDAIQAWKHKAPPGAFTSRFVSPEAQKLQQVVQLEASPVELFFRRLPELVGLGKGSLKEVADAVVRLKQELDSVEQAYRERAELVVRKVLGINASRDAASVQELVQDWVECFSPELVEGLNDGMGRALLMRLRTEHGSDDAIVDTIASMVAGKAPRRWDDSTPPAFERELQQLVARIENAALELGASGRGNAQVALALARLTEKRLQDLVRKLAALVGKENAHAMIRASIEAEINEADDHGDAARSIG